jgi:ketosteroid isomerase-like protein
VAVIRRLYAARAAGDVQAVGALLAEDVVWHEPGSFDYSGDHRGRAAVLDLLARLRGATGGTFRLEARDAVATGEHVAVTVHWSAERAGRRDAGQELAVYRVRDGVVVEAWFFPEFPDPAHHAAVFALPPAG